MIGACRGTLIVHVAAGSECTDDDCHDADEEHAFVVGCEEVRCRCHTDPSALHAVLDSLPARPLRLPSLHPAQRRAAAAVIEGGDALVVAPTGFGKSAIYELAALVRPGPTVVVSPLIALQHDQLAALEERGLGAVALNSTLKRIEWETAWDGIERGVIEFVFVAPEQLARTDVRERIAAHRPSLAVVDEAHCVSEWGHDFRPDYLLLGAAIEALGRPPILALTATAGPATRDDIVDHLRLRDPLLVTAEMDRPNIHLAVRQVHDPAQKPDIVAALLAEAVPAIVYVATRRGADELGDEMVRRGVHAATYHAGLSAAEREDVQVGFFAGELDVVVATTAFGMGIDKPDVRIVVHADPPGSLEQYYQEFGRAGRDDAPAAAVMLFRGEDLAVQRHFASRARLDPELVGDIVAAIEAVPSERIDRAELGDRIDASDRRIAAVLGRLEQSGAVRLEDGGDAVVAAATACDQGKPGAVVEEEVAHERRRASAVEMVRRYAETRSCRRQLLLGFLGEDIGPCGNCDVCESTGVAATEPQPATDDTWQVGAEVVHRSFGTGTVAAREADAVTVLFDTEGYRTLSIAMVEERELLTSESTEY